MNKGIAFVGCGPAAVVHLHALRRGQAWLADRILAAYDPDPARAVDLLRVAGAELAPAESLAALLETPGLQAVILTLPPSQVADAALHCARKNIPFFVDNPVAIGVEDVQNVEREIEDRFLLTAVALQHRYRDSVARVVDHLMNDPPVACQMSWLLPLPAPDQARTVAAAGGLLNLYGSELVDLARYLLGEVSRVFGMANPTPPAPDVPVDSAVQLCLGFEDRTTANLLVAVSPAIHEPGMHVHLFTRSGRLTLSGQNLDLRIDHVGRQTTHASTQDVQAQQLQLFMSAVQRRDGSLLRTSYQDAVRTQAVVAAGMNSIRTGAVQRLRHGTFA